MRRPFRLRPSRRAAARQRAAAAAPDGWSKRPVGPPDCRYSNHGWSETSPGPPLMGLTAHPIPCGADKEIEVGAGVGLLYVVYIEPLPPARGVGEACKGGGVGSAAR
jgi:hypothetical protein